MKKTLSTDAKYKGLKLVDTVYGDDKPDVSTTQAQALLSQYPNLKAIVAPTTVGIAAAAKVVSDQGKSGSVKVTGLGFPNDMKKYRRGRHLPGLRAVERPGPWLPGLSGRGQARQRRDHRQGRRDVQRHGQDLNKGQPYTIGKDSIVVLGPAYRFDKTNVNNFNF